MAQPVIFLLNSNSDILEQMKHTMQEEYGERFHILTETVVEKAIATLRHLQTNNQPVALLLVEQQLPGTSGIDLLRQTRELFPQAKRLLAATYEQSEDVLQAINACIIDNSVNDCLTQPEEQLYPVINDLLDDWSAHFQPPAGRIRIIGHRWSPETYNIKDFLARNQIPYQWLNIEEQGEASQQLAYLGSNANKLPVVIFPDDTYLVKPSIETIAERLPLKTHAEMRFYDVIIIGSGPAGLAAGVYAASEGLRTLIIEKNAPGGQAGSSSRIENYLGFPAGLSGTDLARRAVIQAERFGAEILTPQEATTIRRQGQYHIVRLGDGSEISCHALLIATGVSYRQLDVPGIERLTGAGIYYGASTTEGISCSDEEVFIVGGANSAGQSAIYFAKYARKVTMLVRGDSLSKSMSHYLIEQIQETENIEVKTCTRVVEVAGTQNLEAITIADDRSGKRQTIPASSLFIFIGAQPHTEQLAHLVERDKQGFLLTGPDLLHHGQRPQGWTIDRDPFLLETSVPGIFAAGDVRHGSVKRVAAGVGEGAMAVQFIERYLNQV